MDYYTLPKALYGMEGIRKILSYEENCILHKLLDKDLLNMQKLITAHSIVYVVHGKVRINTYDHEEFVVSNGEMLFMPRDSYLISDYLCDGKNMEVYLLFFNHEIAKLFLDNSYVSMQKKSTICKLRVSKNIKHFFENIEKMHFDTLAKKKLVEVKLLEFLYLISEDEKFKLTLKVSEDSKQKREIEAEMLRHYDKNMTIADFASLSGRSLSTFTREFKVKHNMTPKQWLIKKKMNRAYELLQQGNNVTECAFELGYMNVSNFIRAYKKIYGKTPKMMQNRVI